MKSLKKLTALALAAALALSVFCVGASAKTNAAGQAVETVLFYVTNAAGEEILASHSTVDEIQADMQSGKLDSLNHNYSLLDSYVTTVHQEAQGFTVPEYVEYAQSKSTVPAIRDLDLGFAGKDEIAFWEIDQAAFDDMDTYTYDELYGTARYNFPLLYEYWNYRTQDYYAPAGKMSRDEVINYILENGEQETFLLAVRAYSQRYMATDEKFDRSDYNMENFWKSSDLLDNTRAIRIMKPMTEAELRNAKSTASDSRYWVMSIKLDMADSPDFSPLGQVAEPAATMTEDAENYYIAFTCATPGATILYNQNYTSTSYMPSCEYTGGTVIVPKSAFPNGAVTMTCHAVKDGYTDAGVIKLKLTPSGEYTAWNNSYADVASGAWYYEYVEYVSANGLFDATGAAAFSPDAPMTREMLATALYRFAGEPESGGISSTPFTDVSASAKYADAVAWCYENGVVNGVTYTTFSPESSITREQITAMFHRYAENVAGADMTAANDLAAYTDAARLSGYAVAGMKWAVGAGLINGTTDTTLTPQGTATRAQTAAMVMRLASFVA